MLEDEDKGRNVQEQHDDQQVKDLKEDPEARPVAHKGRLFDGVLMTMNVLVEWVHSLLEHVQLSVLTLPHGNFSYALLPRRSRSTPFPKFLLQLSQRTIHCRFTNCGCRLCFCQRVRRQGSLLLMLRKSH